MKISRRQLKKIIKESTIAPAPMKSRAAPEFAKIIKSNVLIEANPDGTISDGEDNERDLFMIEVEERLNEILDYIISESERIGGPYRGPAIKVQAFQLLADIVHSYR